MLAAFCLALSPHLDVGAIWAQPLLAVTLSHPLLQHRGDQPTTQPAGILLKQPRITPTNYATGLVVARHVGAVEKRGTLNATVQKRQARGTGLTTVQRLITSMLEQGVG